MKEIKNSLTNRKQMILFLMTLMMLLFMQAQPSWSGVTPYVSDANTILLDHLDGSTSATIKAFNQNGQSCGPALPAATPSYSYGPGPNGLTQALTLNPPAGQPAGSATYLEYPTGDILSQANGTLEYWVYLASYSTGGADQGPFRGACAGWTFGMGIDAAGQLSASAWDAFSMNSGTASVPLNTWTHIAATWGSSGAKLYINGVQVGSDTNTGHPAAGYGGYLRLSGYAAGTIIDELRVSNIQRTTFNTPSVPPYISDANTIVLDHFDGSTTATIEAYDNIGGCGSPYPAVTPSYSYVAGPNGLHQALMLNPPDGYPAGSGTDIKYPTGDILSQANGTLEYWVYLPSYATGSAEQWPYKGACAGGTFGMGIDAAGQLSASAWDAFNMNSGTASVPLNTWTHIAATWGSSGAKLYINGVQVGSDTNTGHPATGYGGYLRIIGYAAGTIIDELRVSNIQRTTFNTYNTYTVTASVVTPAGGSVTPASRTVDYGATATFTVTTNTGYTASVSEGTLVGSTWTIPNVTSTHTATVTFTINTYTLTYNAGANGSITGISPQTVNYGASGTAVTAVPATGYHFVQWSDASTTNPRTDNNVTANITVTASFAINTYTLTYTAGANGSITGISPQTVNYGASGTAVTAVPATGYHFVQWSDASTTNPRTDTNVTTNITVTASFALDTYGDFDGDGKTDISVYRASTGAWYVKPSGGSAPYGFGWGGDPNDKPVPGDYDGDGKTDIAVYRASTGAWYVYPSASGVPYGFGWGGDPNDKPVPGDYDGDGSIDIAVYRASTGAWYVKPSGGSAPYGFGWGGDPNDKPVPGDYDGDGSIDIAVYRTSTGAWYVYPSEGGVPYGIGWGGDATDKPVPGDYDGDGSIDIAVYRTSTGAWYVYPSGGGVPYGIGWGGDPSDIPLTVNPN